MVMPRSMVVLIHIRTNQYFKCYELSSSGFPASITHNIKSIEFLIKQNETNTKSLLGGGVGRDYWLYVLIER